MNILYKYIHKGAITIKLDICLFSTFKITEIYIHMEGT